MASPNACGGLALLLSAMLAEGQVVTPARVQRAVENTCQAVGEAGDPAAVLTYGRGLLQVRNSFSLLLLKFSTFLHWVTGSGGKKVCGEDSIHGHWLMLSHVCSTFCQVDAGWESPLSAQRGWACPPCCTRRLVDSM